MDKVLVCTTTLIVIAAGWLRRVSACLITSNSHDSMDSVEFLVESAIPV